MAISETSLQHVSMVFRSEPQWEIVEPLLDFGMYYMDVDVCLKSDKNSKNVFLKNLKNVLDVE